MTAAVASSWPLQGWAVPGRVLKDKITPELPQQRGGRMHFVLFLLLHAPAAPAVLAQHTWEGAPSTH